MKKSAIKSSVFSLLPLNDSAIWLEDKILLMDHLELPSPPLQQGAQAVGSRFPMKLSMSCMLIVVKGTVSLRVNLSDYKVAAESCIVIARNAIVEHVAIDADSSLVILMAADEFHAGTISLEPVMQAQLLPPLLDMLLTTSRMLRTVLTDPSFEPGREDVARDCIRLMSSIASQSMKPREDSLAKPNRRDQIVSRFLQCVAANYRTHRDLGFYAGELGLSLKHMSHVIHEQTGRHPSQWIKDHVILDAKTMLRSGNYTVQQVSDELNFANQSFFGKYFKEAVGVSPKKWFFSP